jgi:hypothetical protein
MASVSLPAELMRRNCRLFSVYDRDGGSRHTMEGDFEPVAVRIARRWQGRPSRFPDLLGMLLDTYRHENGRRDQNHDGTVDGEEFLASHGRLFAAFRAFPQAACRGRPS